MGKGKDRTEQDRMKKHKKEKERTISKEKTTGKKRNLMGRK